MMASEEQVVRCLDVVLPRIPQPAANQDRPLRGQPGTVSGTQYRTPPLDGSTVQRPVPTADTAAVSGSTGGRFRYVVPALHHKMTALYSGQPPPKIAFLSDTAVPHRRSIKYLDPVTDPPFSSVGCLFMWVCVLASSR